MQIVSINFHFYFYFYGIMIQMLIYSLEVGEKDFTLFNELRIHNIFTFNISYNMYIYKCMNVTHYRSSFSDINNAISSNATKFDNTAEIHRCN